jgi:DtxR family Mn-dependent transcriptional regulator
MSSEDALKWMLKAEIQGADVSLQSLAGALEMPLDSVAELLDEMQRRGLIHLHEGVPRLTSEGRDAALHVVRAHRLWERYLADRTGTAETDWHEEAERIEHELSREDVRRLSAELGNPLFDPHGDPIPEEGGRLRATEGVPLSSLPPDTSAAIVHIEDEPPAVYAQLVAEGLTTGMRVVVVESGPRRIRFWADGNEITLAPIIANNITTVELHPEIRVDAGPKLTLADVSPGEQATVTGISPACRGVERRRLLDLGIVPGTTIVAEREAPGRDPVAYRIRGAAVALRREQSRLISVVLTKRGKETS